MKLSIATLASIFAGLSAYAKADCDYVDGNYYCSQTNGVVYKNVGYSGSYSDVTDMDESSCKCTQETVSFDSSLSPLDEELSVHFRGPLKLLQFGVYYPGSSSSSKKKREAVAEEEDCTTTRHLHHQHKRAPAVAYVEVTATVVIDADGNTVTSEATVATTSPAEEKAATTSTEAKQAATTSSEKEAATTSSKKEDATTSSSEKESSTSSSEKESSSSSSSDSVSGDWIRSSYFQPGSTTNVTFLNTLGASSSSGTWSSCFGNSISFCGSDGVSVASSATALDEVTIDSNVEYLIMSGSSCDDDSTEGDCGYYRADIPAYHGFGGASKIFVFEFEMPSASDDASTNYDMPAIWLLNAKIPRTLQYGDSSCSCWSTGCGEMDLFEILSSGSDKLISHIHSGQGDNGSSTGGGGSQDYFDRPTSSSMKAAAVFNDGEISIVVLDDSTDFGSSFSSSDINSWLDAATSSSSLSS